MSQPKQFYYALSTHWDREFYQDFQGFRYRLVDILDGVLEGFNDGQLDGSFQMDGQSCPMEDYLDVRPERREVFEQRVREGLIRLGPWYTMPDLFIPSGESMIRNLELGMKVAREAGGEPSRVLFCCDVFGMPSQAPQVAAGFNLKFGYIWRGTNRPDIRHLDWIGADGSRLPCYRFGQNSYWGYGVHVRNVNKSDVRPSVERFADDLAHYTQSEAGCTQPSAVLLFDGIDHAAWDAPHYALLKPYLKPGGKDGIQVIHCDLDTYADAALADWDAVDVSLHGELREPGLRKHKANESAQAVLPGTLSNRVWIKQQNHHCETLLCQLAEPLAALQQHLLDKPTAPGLFATAWRYLLKNHFHDSIYGSYSDETDHDMRARFRQSQRIAEEIIKDCAQRIAAHIESNADHCITLFNPLAYPRKEIVEAEFFLPDKALANDAFRLTDHQGNEIPYQTLDRFERRHRLRCFPYKEPLHEHCAKVRVALPVEVGGTGYRNLHLVSGEPSVTHPENVAATSDTLENEHLRVKVHRNGTLTLTDKANNTSYTDLLELEDAGDRGGHFFVNALPQDKPIRSGGARAAIETVHGGPLSAALKISYKFELPARADQESRSSETVYCPVAITIRLEAGSAQLKVTIEVDNQAKDHWLRVRFPLGMATNDYVTNTPFDAITRPVEPGYVAEELSEPVPVGFPQESWMAAANGKRGLVIIAPGLKEAGANQEEAGTTLFLSLLRATEKFKFVDSNPYAQLLGCQHFEFGLRPIRTIDPAAHNAQAQMLAAPPVLAQTDKVSRYKYRTSTAKSLAPEHSLVEVEPSVTVSAFRPVGKNCYELRLYNPSDAPEAAKLKLDPRLTKLQFTDLEGRPKGQLAPQEATPLGTKKIQTIRIQ